MPKYDTLVAFIREYKKLTPAQQQAFMAAVHQIIALLAAGTFPSPPLVQKLGGYDLYEVRWAANGRATFEYAYDATLGEHVVIWRRIGDHSILSNP